MRGRHARSPGALKACFVKVRARPRRWCRPRRRVMKQAMGCACLVSWIGSVFSCRRANVRRMIDAQQIEFRSHPIPCAYACEHARIRPARAAPQPAQPSALQAPAHAGGAGIEPEPAPRIAEPGHVPACGHAHAARDRGHVRLPALRAPAARHAAHSPGRAAGALCRGLAQQPGPLRRGPGRAPPGRLRLPVHRHHHGRRTGPGDGFHRTDQITEPATAYPHHG